MRPEWKVGVLTLSALALGAVLVLRIEEVHWFRKKSQVFSARLSSADGLEEKAPVRFIGVKIGSVRGIFLEGQGVRVEFELEKKVVLPEGSWAVVESLGFLGERHLELYPGPAGAPPLPEGHELPGKTSADWNDALTWASEIGEDVEAVTKNLHFSLGDEVGQERIEKWVTSLLSLTSQLAELVEKNQENVNASLELLRQTSGQLYVASGKLNSILEKVDSAEGSVGQWISSKETSDRLNESLASVQKGVQSLNQVVDRVVDTRLDMGLRTEFLTASNRGKGYFHLDIVPPKSSRFYRLEAVSQPFGLRERTTTTTKVTDFIEGGAPLTRTETVEKATDNFAFSAQVAQRLGPWVLRGGLLESTGGAGVDLWLLQQRLRLTAEAWDFDRRGPAAHAKLHAALYPTRNLYLLAGWDDLLNRSLQLDSFFLGAGARWDAEDIKYLLPSVPTP